MVVVLAILLNFGLSLSAQYSEEYLERVDSADYYIKQKRWLDAERYAYCLCKTNDKITMFIYDITNLTYIEYQWRGNLYVYQTVH